MQSCVFDLPLLMKEMKGPDFIGNRLLGCEDMHGGLTNFVYKVTTDAGVYAVTAFAKNRDPYYATSHEDAHAFQRACHEAGLPVAKPFGKINSIRGFDYQVTEFIPGETRTRLTPEQAHAVGKMVGQLHAKSQGMPPLPRIPQGALDVAASELSEAIGRLKDRASIKKEIAYLGSMVQVATHRLLHVERAHAKLPRGIIHGDLNPGNLIFDEKTGKPVAIIDFEKCRNGAFVEDIAYLLYTFALQKDLSGQYRLDVPTMVALLDGYNTERKMSRAEIDFLPHEMKDRALIEDSVLRKLKQYDPKGESKWFDDAADRLKAVQSELSGRGMAVMELKKYGCPDAQAMQPAMR